MSACAKSPDRRAQRRQVLHACARQRAAERSAAPKGRREARPAIQEIAMSACAKSPDRRAQRRQVLHACARQRAAERSAAPHGRREARPAIQGLS
jgi:hypothetical protein